jgi:hypothetical protein
VANVQLTLNTNITSRLVGGGYQDALLLIDEPYPTQTNPGPAINGLPNNNPGTVTIPANSPPQVVCASNLTPVAGQCNYLTGTFDGNAGASTAYGGTNSPYLQTAVNNNGQEGGGPASTIYVAHQAAANIVTWLGVPIDAPGTTGVRVVRITNVRANACQLGLSSTLIPTQIVGFLQVTGAPFITINNPQQTLAYIQQGLVTSGQNTNLQQCTNLNSGNGIGGNFFAPGPGWAVTNVNLREGFAQSFKRRNYSANAFITGLYQGEVRQNVPGYAYNTEGGFQPSQDGINNAPTNRSANYGRADTGTRFLLRFNNVPTGTRILLPFQVALTTGNGVCGGAQPTPPSDVNDGSNCPGSGDNVNGRWGGGFLQLLGTSDLNGNTGGFSNASGPGTGFFTNNATFFSSPPFKGPGTAGNFGGAAEVTITANTAAVVYEVVNSDPSAVEIANIPIGVAFISNTANNLPTPGQATVNASFAPLSTVNTASSGDPIPRFCDRSTPQNTFNVNVCVCNLLFPFVTQAPGFDTGIAIANTTTDPYGTTPQTGPVDMYFYGQVTGGGALPTALQHQTTTGNIPSGQVMTWTTFGGAGAFAAGLQPTPGFTGYMIAIAKFQYCHGFAFISDLGAQKLAEGYLAIQLDLYGGTGLNRTGVIGEVQAH